MSEPGGLVSEEGVDEGSAASTQEGPRSVGGGGDLLGAPPHGAPVDEAQAAAPVDMDTEQARAARAARSPGQELQEGEG